MGFFTFAVAGGGFMLIGAAESLKASPLPSTSPSPADPTLTLDASSPSKPNTAASSSSSVPFLIASVLSSLFVVDSLVSIFSALSSHDRLGSALQLQSLAVAALFLLYSLLGIASHCSKTFPLPSKLLDSILLFAFGEEFLLFYLQRKDTSGVENRYFDLMLVPIAACAVSTILELKSPKARVFTRLGRGFGLILQGMWFLQMSVSFFTGLISHGCSLHEKSRGNYTIKCKGHPEYHRARAIATLQFNCHLALLVALAAGAYAVFVQKYGIRMEDVRYRPLGEDLRGLGGSAQFTLIADEDDVDGDGIREEEIAGKSKSDHTGGSVEMTVNGHETKH